MGTSIALILKFTSFNQQTNEALEPIVLTQPEVNMISDQKTINIDKLYQVLKTRNPHLKYDIQFDQNKPTQVKVNYENNGSANYWIYKLSYD